ncbi:MAG: twin-arginine translocase TatA/TatE family subunit [Thermoguttaceae bacterium]
MLPLAFDLFSPTTMLMLAVLAVLLYGERLPEVARNLGKQFIELKKSLQGIRDQFEEVTREVTTSMERPSPRPELSTEREEATAPKFEPPPSEPVAEAAEH